MMHYTNDVYFTYFAYYFLINVHLYNFTVHKSTSQSKWHSHTHITDMQHYPIKITKCIQVHTTKNIQVSVAC